MEQFIDLLKITLPAIIVLYAAYLLTKAFIGKEYGLKLAQIKGENAAQTLTLRLQAYERMAIFLERIAPANLVPRLNNPDFNVVQLQSIMTNEIRQEFSHNISQQIYMSDQSWNMIKKAMEEVISLINNAANDLQDDQPSMMLAKRIFEIIMQEDRDTTDLALRFIKSEIREIFTA